VKERFFNGVNKMASFNMDSRRKFNRRKKKVMRKIILILTITLVLTTNYYSQTGALPADLDSTYGGTGYVISNDTESQDAAINRKGQIVVANGNGLTVYAGDGRVLNSVITPVRAFRAALQSNDYIVTIGRIETGPNGEVDIVLARYKPNLNLDKSFGNNGITQLRINNLNYNLALSLAIQNDDRIIVGGRVGQSFLATDYQQFLARFTESGKLDASFRGGYFIEPESYSHQVASISLLELQNRKEKTIVVGGFMRDCPLSTCPTYGTVRVYDQDGMRVGSFNQGQTQKIPNTGGNVSVQNDGKILLPFGNFANQTIGVARLLPNGALDSSFGNGGFASLQILPNPRVTSVKADMFGRIVLVGYLSPIQETKILVARFTPSGGVDANFTFTPTTTTPTVGFRSFSFPNEPSQIPFGFVFYGNQILGYGRLGATAVSLRSFLFRLNNQ